MERYIKVQTALDIIDKYAKTVDENGKEIVDAVRDIVEVITPTADVVTKSEVARGIEAFDKKVGQIYNHYVFEDTDYAYDDVAIEAVINALTEVLNDLAELKKKYTEDQSGE